MQQVSVTLLLLIGWANLALGQTDAEMLIAKSDPVIQAQVKAAVNAALSNNLSKTSTNWEGARELNNLKELTDNEEKIIEQLAIYAITEEEPEEHKDLQAIAVLNTLHIRPAVVIRVLAPYLDTDNQQLHGFAEMWFDAHDNADSAPPRSPPFKPVNYDDYEDYVSRKLGRSEEVPAGFIRYVYQRSPGRALLVFAYASRTPDMAARLKLMRNVFEARKQGKVPEPQDVTAQQLEERGKVRSKARREIRLAEHIVSNAIWLKENEFAERFEAALPETMAELAKLAKHEEWWARLYVAYIMREHPELRHEELIQQLREDKNELVRKAARSAKGKE
jgi:hypothetical protein